MFSYFDGPGLGESIQLTLKRPDYEFIDVRLDEVQYLELKVDPNVVDDEWVGEEYPFLRVHHRGDRPSIADLTVFDLYTSPVSDIVVDDIDLSP